MDKKRELAVDYFQRHPLSQECHVTSDNRVFHTKGSADSFAGSLKDNAVTPFKRTEVLQSPTTAPDQSGASSGTPDKVEKTAEELAIELGAFNRESADYDDAKALAFALKLQPASRKKDDIYAALEAEQKRIADEAANQNNGQ